MGRAGVDERQYKSGREHREYPKNCTAYRRFHAIDGTRSHRLTRQLIECVFCCGRVVPDQQLTGVVNAWYSCAVPGHIIRQTLISFS